jgi:transposase
MAGIARLRYDTAGRAYYRRKRAAGKTSMEAMRCLRRRLSDAVYRQLAADALAQEKASPGGHPAASWSSSAAGLSPDTGTSDQPLPGPAPQTLPPPPKTPKAMAPAAASPRRRARGDGLERPTGRTNDVDTDQRRRTLNSAGAMPLTDPFIEGSHDRTFILRAALHRHTAGLIVRWV